MFLDAFGEIRDRHRLITENMKSKCFICGIDHGIFERYGNGFRAHIQEDHNMWAYLYFFLYLDFKKPTKYTAQEVNTFVDCLENQFLFLGLCS